MISISTSQRQRKLKSIYKNSCNNISTKHIKTDSSNRFQYLFDCRIVDNNDTFRYKIGLSNYKNQSLFLFNSSLEIRPFITISHPFFFIWSQSVEWQVRTLYGQVFRCSETFAISLLKIHSFIGSIDVLKNHCWK